jgi:hypothetical protein
MESNPILRLDIVGAKCEEASGWQIAVVMPEKTAQATVASRGVYVEFSSGLKMS